MTWILLIILSTSQIEIQYATEDACYRSLAEIRVGNDTDVVAVCRPGGG